MKVLLHTTDVVTSQVVEILQKAKELSGVKESFEFAPLEDTYVPPRGVPVLSLGSYKRRGQERVVQTYSVKQIMVKGDAISRLITAFKLLESVPELPEFEYEVVDSHTRLQEISAELEGTEFAVDIETSGSADAQVPVWEQIISLAFYGGDKAYVVTEELSQDLIASHRTLAPLLEESHTILHNGKFDMKYLSIREHLYPDDDTMLMHYALHPAASDHGLKALALEYFGAEDWDSGNKQYLKKQKVTERLQLEDGAYAVPGVEYTSKNGYERIPRTQLYEYNAWDVYWTFWLWRIFKVELEDLEPSPYGHLMELSHMFQRIEAPGVRYDVDYMEQLQSELTTTGVQLENELHELVGFPLNPRSPKQLKEYFTLAGYNVKSTDAEALTKLSSEGSEVAGLISKLRDNNKQNGTYVTGYLDKLVDGRGYPTFKLHASITGRIGGGGPSLLTIPTDNKIRRMALPDVGHKWVGADLSQAELRVMALESQDPWLIEAFQPEAGDFFDILLSQALPKHDWFALHKAPDPDGFYNNWRRSMKSVVYGASFARGAKAIALELGIPVRDSEMLMEAFIRPGSEFDQWREGVKLTVLEGRPLVNRFGRRFQSELITRRNEANVLRSALSFISQSTGNDILLSTALRVEPQLDQYGSRLIGTIHDAMEASVPPEHGEAVGELMAYELTETGKQVYGEQVLFTSDWNIGDSLGDN